MTVPLQIKHLKNSTPVQDKNSRKPGKGANSPCLVNSSCRKPRARNAHFHLKTKKRRECVQMKGQWERSRDPQAHPDTGTGTEAKERTCKSKTDPPPKVSCPVQKPRMGHGLK